MIGDHEYALRDFNRVIDLQPTNAHAFFRRAFTYKAMKRYHDAAEDFNTARKLQPNNPALLINAKKLHGVSCIVLCRPGDEPDFPMGD